MMSEQTVQSAMSIILHAGDARVACKEALDAISEADFETAEVKLKEAQTKLQRLIKCRPMQFREKPVVMSRNILFCLRMHRIR